MENETEVIEESAENEVEEITQEEPEPKSEKKVFSPEEQLAIHKRETKKLEKKLGIQSEEAPQRTKSDDLDKGDRALLVAYGIKGQDELALAKSWLTRTGDDIDTLVEDDIFQAKLKNLREAKASSDAIPKGNRRSSPNQVSDVDYWLAKGELPPDTNENRELRAKIVNAEIKRERDASPFKSGGNKLIIK